MWTSTSATRPTECLNPSKTTISVKPFTTQVAQRLQTISNNIATRAPQAAADIGFVNNTSEPVYKMLAIANAVPGSNTAESLIETYKDVIALDYAETFLGRAIKQALTALSQSLKRTEVESRYVENIRASATGRHEADCRREADRLRQGPLGLLHGPGPAEPRAPALERDAAGGQVDARFQRQCGPSRLKSRSPAVPPTGASRRCPPF